MTKEEQLERQLAQVELKNLELQASAIEHELTAMQATINFFSLRGPMLEATHKELQRQILERKDKKA